MIECDLGTKAPVGVDNPINRDCQVVLFPLIYQPVTLARLLGEVLFCLAYSPELGVSQTPYE